MREQPESASTTADTQVARRIARRRLQSSRANVPESASTTAHTQDRVARRIARRRLQTSHQQTSESLASWFGCLSSLHARASGMRAFTPRPSGRSVQPPQATRLSAGHASMLVMHTPHRCPRGQHTHVLSSSPTARHDSAHSHTATTQGLHPCARVHGLSRQQAQRH